MIRTVGSMRAHPSRGWARIVVAAAAAALALIPSGAARAAPAAAAPGGFAAGFATPVVIIAQGEGVTFHNFDIAPHDFVAQDAFLSKKAARRAKWCSGFDGKCPLFWSPKIGVGESTEVLGLKAVRSGKSYAFYCTVHPNMKGTLVVR